MEDFGIGHLYQVNSMLSIIMTLRFTPKDVSGKAQHCLEKQLA
ncbi:hypothetical protein V6R21_26790 [Limibacter armeniacum]